MHSIFTFDVIPPAIVLTFFFTVCLPTVNRSVDTVIGQYLPSPLPALCANVIFFFSISNWNFNCSED